MEQTVLERAQPEGTPLIEGSRATFVWCGPQAPQFVGDLNGWGWREPKITLGEENPGVWTYTLELEPDAYLEYGFQVGEERLDDPLNSRKISNGMGGFNNYFTMPAFEATTLVETPRGFRRGAITRHVVENGYLLVGGRRVVHLYHPPTDEPCPLLVVYDGQDYLKQGRLPQMVDNLIAQGRIRPIAMAMVNHGKQARFIEYNCCESTVDFLLRDVIPMAREHLNLLDPEEAPGSYGVLGASMGGLMALYTGMRVPQVFGRVLSQSGAFLFELAGTPSVLRTLIRCEERKPLQIWMDVGRYEFLIESNRNMLAMLQAKEYAVAYREYSAAHNYTAWRNDVWRGLEAIFGV